MAEAQSIKYRLQFLIFILATGLLVILALGATWNNGRLARAAEAETLAYNHGKHVAAGIQCVYCHPGVLEGAVAGIPSTAKCMGCHRNVQVSAGGQEDVNVLLAHWEAGEPLRWMKTFDQPDFVQFAHRPHISAGVACEECHGAVAEMAQLEQTVRHNMGFCLGCHRQQEPEKVKRLETCSTCHY